MVVFSVTQILCRRLKECYFREGWGLKEQSGHVLLGLREMHTRDSQSGFNISGFQGSQRRWLTSTSEENVSSVLVSGTELRGPTLGRRPPSAIPSLPRSFQGSAAPCLTSLKQHPPAEARGPWKVPAVAANFGSSEVFLYVASAP